MSQLPVPVLSQVLVLTRTWACNGVESPRLSPCQTECRWRRESPRWRCWSVARRDSEEHGECSWPERAGTLLARVPVNTEHRGNTRERLDLKERNTNPLVVLVANDLALFGNLLQVCVSDAPVSNKLRPASQYTSASKTEIKHQNTSICHRMWPNVTPTFVSNSLQVSELADFPKSPTQLPGSNVHFYTPSPMMFVSRDMAANCSGSPWKYHIMSRFQMLKPWSIVNKISSVWHV